MINLEKWSLENVKSLEGTNYLQMLRRLDAREKEIKDLIIGQHEKDIPDIAKGLGFKKVVTRFEDGIPTFSPKDHIEPTHTDRLVLHVRRTNPDYSYDPIYQKEILQKYKDRIVEDFYIG